MDPQITAAIITGSCSILVALFAVAAERRSKSKGLKATWYWVVIIILAGLATLLVVKLMRPPCARLFLDRSHEALLEVLRTEHQFLDLDSNWKVNDQFNTAKAKQDVVKRSERIRSKLDRFIDDIDRCRASFSSKETDTQCRYATEFANKVEQTLSIFQNVSTNLASDAVTLDAQRSKLRDKLLENINFQDGSNR